MPHISVYAAAAVLSCLVVPWLYKALSSPVRSIPGPLLARFTRLWIVATWRRGHMEHDLLGLHEKYGPVVRYAPNYYSFSDPEAIKAIHGQGVELDKAEWYDAWSPPGSFRSLFTERHIKANSQLRRKFMPTYTMSTMLSYEPFANECIALIDKHLQEIANAGGRTDLVRWLFAYAGDAIFMITTSKRLGFLDAGDDVGGFFRTLRGSNLYSTFAGFYIGLHPILFRFTALLVRLGLRANSKVVLDKFTRGLVQEKRAERQSEAKAKRSGEEIDKSAPEDFVSKFLDFREDETKNFSEADIYAGLSGNINAGSESTATTLISMFYGLLKNPAAYGKLRDEVDSAVKDGRLSSPPTFKEAHELPYLQVVIQETLRMYSTTGIPLQRLVRAGGREICGHFFPEGSIVGMHPLALHRNKAVWGDDAYEFRPERWLEADKETRAMMDRCLMSFGLGQRTCIGKNVALLEIAKLVPELVRKFDFELTDGLERKDERMQWLGRWIVIPLALPVKIKLRDAASPQTSA